MRKYFILFLTMSTFLSLSTEALPANDRNATVTLEVNLNVPADVKAVRLWLPYPLSDEWQDITEIHARGDYDSISVYAEPLYGNKALYAQWTGRLQQRKLVYSFHVKRKEQSAGPIAQDSRQA